MPRRLITRTTQPLIRFLHVESAGGIVLLAATLVGVAAANSPWRDGWADLWHREVSIRLGSYHFDADWRHLVNELLLAMFFFVVGLEIKRELVVGQLRDRRAVALPAIAALGGMVVPALVYAAFNAGGAGSRGWSIPMATDIAFAMGVVALLGSRVPGPAKLMLLTLAVVDDIGAIVVIAVFYSSGLKLWLLAVAVAVAMAVAMLYRRQLASPWVIAVAGLVLWLVVYESGVHATIAGVVMGLLTPARAIRGDSMCDRFIERLHPLSSFVVVPLFALANAGVELRATAITSPTAVFAGAAVGLVVGKLVGIAGFGWLAVRLGWARLPDGTRWRHVVGIAAIGGIGFTVSLFIAGLAFGNDSVLQSEAILGTFVGSVAAALVGVVVLLRIHAAPSEAFGDRTTTLTSG